LLSFGAESFDFQVAIQKFKEVLKKYIRGLLEKYPTVFFYANT